MNPTELEELAKAFAAHNSTVEAGLAAHGAEIDRLNAALAGFKVGGGAGAPGGAGLHEAKRAMLAFARGDLGALSYKGAGGGDVFATAAASVDSGPGGGYTVPQILSDVINDQLVNVSPIRAAAAVEQISVGDYTKLVNRRGTSSGWRGERGTVAETSTPQFAGVTPPGGELYAQPIISQWLLQDSKFDMGDFLVRNVADEFAFQEGAAFIAGDGIEKPRGFLTCDKVTTGDATRAFGALQYIPSGVAAALTDSTHNGADKILDLVYALKPAYRAGAGVAWMMNSATAAVVRKLKSKTDENYLWQPSLQAGQPAMLAGYPVIEAEDMPDIGAGNYPIAFGNWKRGYLIVDKGADRIIRDDITTKGFVKFYVARRVHGSLLDSNAIKLLKIAAT